MKRQLLVVIGTLIALAPSGALGQTVFTQLSGPVGVTADRVGNVFVTSDAFTSTLITKFAPNGAGLSQVRFGNLFSIGAVGYLATEPSTGLIVDVLSDGTLLLLDPDSGQLSPLLNLRQLPIDTSSIFDVQTGRVGNMNGVIVPQRAQYGDLAILTRGPLIDVFVSGLSVGFPFVMRLQFVNGQLRSARVLVSSTGPALSTNLLRVNLPRGVAVNSQGTVLTSLPVFGPVATVNAASDRAVAFGADFAEGRGFAPRVVLNGVDLASRGMATDPAGNFYVATGSVGTTLCGPSGYGLVTVAGTVDRAGCARVAGFILNSSDVAVRPQGDAAYLVVQNLNVVARFPLR